VRIGQLLGVEAVVTGTATLNTGRVEVFARIISVENALIIGSARVQVAARDVPLRGSTAAAPRETGRTRRLRALPRQAVSWRNQVS
jgi:hypothetical protein